MRRHFARPAGFALVLGLIALGGSAAEAGSFGFGANLNIRTSSQNLPQTVYASGGHNPNVGPGETYTPPPYSYGGPSPHVHTFDCNTEFDGATDNSTNGKLPK